jgi:cation-transporting ATPase 13A2
MKIPLNNTTRNIRQKLFGDNEIKVPVKSILQLLIDEVLHPFYLFQIVSCIIWYADSYYVYATVIVATSTLSAILGLIETRSNLTKLRAMAKFESAVKRAFRSSSGSYRKNSSRPIEYVFNAVSSKDLVPGDIIEIDDGSILPCDIMLISGQCIVNEAMLTGESIPIVKTPIPNHGHANDLYSVNNHRNHTLYSGTQVVQTKLFGGTKVLGICVRTGYETAKGKLMLSILFPKPTQFKFYQDSFKFIGVMLGLGFLGIIYSAIRLRQKGVPVLAIALRAMDVITISVPPALPIAMTVGVGFAISRLKKRSIFCISPPRVNVSGKINCMCFDKTGTLTEEGLDLYGVRSISMKDTGVRTFDDLVDSTDVVERLFGEKKRSENDTLLLYAMASCHSLTYVKNDLVGDPLEQKIFQATQWELDEPQHTDTQHEMAIPAIVRPMKTGVVQSEEEIDFENLPLEIGILRRFDFSSALQRMSVIAKNLQTSETLVFVKGSPEAIGKLSRKDTLPVDYESVLYGYAHRGYRVLACGYKKMKSNFDWRKAQKAKREEIEEELVFLGLIVMQNRMKRDTPSVIKKLDKASIETIMVTGDNAYTAISVGRQCGIISKTVRVYLGELTSNTDGQIVTWKDIENSEATLNSDTLLPSDGVQVGDYELAITGSVFEHLLTEHNNFMNRREEEEAIRKRERRSKPKGWDEQFSLFHRAVILSHIFARMSPDQKLILSEQLQQLGYFVGFCGDGANDCGALKASHIGISLSEAEASIAAPFTSLKPTIACVPAVIKEGRAALQTSFQMFKYIACYSMIQFFTVILLYETNSTLGDYQFLFVDLGLILPTVMLMSRTSARSVLVSLKPVGSLINRVVLLSLFGQLLIAFGTSIFAFWFVRQQDFYAPIVPRPNTKENIFCFETTTLFALSTFQTFGCALAYSISKPFKKPLHTNRLYTFMLLFVFGGLVYMILEPGVYTRYWLEFVEVPTLFRFKLLGIAVCQIILAYSFERVFIAGPGQKLIKLASVRKFRALLTFIFNYYNHRISKTGSGLITAKLLRSRKKYNILKKQFYESYFILRTQRR